MHFSSLFAAFAAITTVLAAPSTLEARWGQWGSCLSDRDASTYVTNFIKTLQIGGNDTANYNTALAAVANQNIQEISDSSNFLGGYPLGSVTLNGFAAFQAFHATSPPGGVYQVQTLNIWHTCNVITWRWRFILYPGAQPIQGINVFVLNGNGKADVLYDEFNSAVWAEDLGYTVTPPPAGAPHRR